MKFVSENHENQLLKSYELKIFLTFAPNFCYAVQKHILFLCLVKVLNNTSLLSIKQLNVFQLNLELK